MFGLVCFFFKLHETLGGRHCGYFSHIRQPRQQQHRSPTFGNKRIVTASAMVALYVDVDFCVRALFSTGLNQTST